MAIRGSTITFIAGVSLLCGCGARTELRAGDVEGAQTSGCDPTEPEALRLEGTLRDFRISHPDFEEGFLGDDPGIVAAELGADGLPVYAGSAGNPSTSDKQAFDQWYRDVPGVNLATGSSIPLDPIGGGFVFASAAFFPIDGQLFGNEGLEHNFHFTLETHVSFRYRGGEVFAFEGDDDLWAFFDGRLILDLGGVHSSLAGTVVVDDWAAELGLERGKIYPLDLFSAERQTSGSTFQVTMTGFQLCE